MQLLLGMFFAIAISLPPAAKALAVMGVVYGLIQALKQAPFLTPYLTGIWAIALNVVLTSLGLLIAIPADQLYTTNTLLTLLSTALGAAGVHGTVKLMSAPAVPATAAVMTPSGPASAPAPTKLTVLLLLACMLPLGLLAGCTNWERATFQTLAASKAVIDQAQADYEAGKVIPHNEAAYTVINKAKAADSLAVTAMAGYEQIKATGGSASALASAETTVTVALADLPAALADVKALYAPPPAAK